PWPLAWCDFAWLRPGREAAPQEGQRPDQDRGLGQAEGSPCRTRCRDIGATRLHPREGRGRLAGRRPARPDAKTIETNPDALKPLLADLGSIRLADLTAHDVRSALTKMAARYSTPHLAKGS